MSAQDPFYLVKEEIQETVDKIKKGHLEYEKMSPLEREERYKELVAGCESIEWQLEELDKAVSVAERDPLRFSVDAAEIERRRRWSSLAHSQIALIKRSLAQSTADRPAAAPKDGQRRELLRLPESSAAAGRAGPRADANIVRGNEAFIGGEDDRQALLIRQQDEHLEQMSMSLAKIGGLGIAIHEELGSQDKLISELNSDVENTNSRLGMVQKKMQAVLKKAGVKGQLCLIIALIILLLVLIVLVFYT